MRSVLCNFPQSHSTFGTLLCFHARPASSSIPLPRSVVLHASVGWLKTYGHWRAWSFLNVEVNSWSARPRNIWFSIPANLDSSRYQLWLLLVHNLAVNATKKRKHLFYFMQSSTECKNAIIIARQESLFIFTFQPYWSRSHVCLRVCMCEERSVVLTQSPGYSQG